MIFTEFIVKLLKQKPIQTHSIYLSGLVISLLLRNIILEYSVNVSDKAHHAFLRKVMNPAFSPSSLQSLEPTVQRHLDRFILEIKKDAQLNNGIVDMTAWFANLAFAVLTIEFELTKR